MVRLVGAGLLHADVAGLGVGQLGQPRVQLLELQARDLLVEVLGQHVDPDRVLLGVGEELDLGDDLVGERGAHHVARVAGAAAQVDQPPLGEQDDARAVGEDDVIDLRLDVLPLVLLERRDVDLAVEVADIAHDRVVLHPLHVLVGDDVVVAGGGHEDVRQLRGLLHRHHAVAFHRGLQRADRVDLGDPHLGRQRAEGLGRALAHVAVAAHHRDLARHHDVGGPLDAVHQRLPAAVEVVELALGHRVVDVDGRELEPPLLGHLVEPLHPGGGFLADAADLGEPGGVPGRVLGKLRLDRREEGGLFLVGRVGDDGGVLLRHRAQVQQQGGVAAVVQDHVGVGAVGPLEDAVGVIPVLLERLALPREHRGARGRDRGGGVVLGREDIAGGPAHVRAERLQGLDQDRGLDRHVERAGDAGAPQGLQARVLLADGHETGHLGLGDLDLLAAPVGEAQIGDDVVLGPGRFACGAHLAPSLWYGSLRAPLPTAGPRGRPLRAWREGLPSQRSSELCTGHDYT